MDRSNKYGKWRTIQLATDLKTQQTAWRYFIVLTFFPSREAWLNISW